ncbi:MAG: MotA/TolQ/ExbB proton channel family protein [Anaerovoracaceae bacterium]
MASVLQTPTIVILLFIIAETIIMLGSIIAELFTERKRMKARIPTLVDQIQGKTGEELLEVIDKSGLLKRQRQAIRELVTRELLPEKTRDAVARQLLFEEQTHYDKITKLTDVVARVAPMFGLLGTLIPLGPGLIALGQGDTKTLSESLLIAFDTTIAGLISAAVAYVISAVRKNWYEEYLVSLETIMESILEEQNKKG